MKSKSGPITSKEIFSDKYKIIEKKGIGGTARVYLVIEKDTNQEYIAKLVKDNDYFNREKTILRNLKAENNQNIIQIIESGKTSIERIEYPDLNYIILEYASNRELYDYVDYAGSGFGETYGKIIFAKILNGIRCIHNLGICHKDLSMSNIFLDEEFNPKIGDFGSAMINANNIKEYFGTKGYTAPEINRNEPYDGIQADIFSLGAILMFLVFNKQGFKNANDSDPFYKLIIDQNFHEYWENMELVNDVVPSDEFKDLYQRMISPFPGLRPNVNFILGHNWLLPVQNIDNQTLTALRNEFLGRKDKIKKSVTIEIKYNYKHDNADYKNDIKPHTKSGNDNSSSNSKPKNIPDYLTERFCVKICDYNDANKLLNSLCQQIINHYGNSNTFIEKNDGKFKMDVSLEKQGESIEMKIKFYSDKNGLVLKFFKKKGDKKIFFETFKEISDMVKKLIE